MITFLFPIIHLGNISSKLKWDFLRLTWFWVLVPWKFRQLFLWKEPRVLWRSRLSSSTWESKCPTTKCPFPFQGLSSVSRKSSFRSNRTKSSSDNSSINLCWSPKNKKIYNLTIGLERTEIWKFLYICLSFDVFVCLPNLLVACQKQLCHYVTGNYRVRVNCSKCNCSNLDCSTQFSKKSTARQQKCQLLESG